MEEKIDRHLDRAANARAVGKIAEWAGKYSGPIESEIASLRAGLDAGLHDFIADVLAAACRLDCERRDAAAAAIKATFEASIARHGMALARLTAFVEGKYDAVMTKLRRDLRIFSGSSFAALFFAFLLAVFRGKAAAQLLPFSLALSLATLLAATWYFFGQNWIMTVLYSDYWGWAYPILLLVIAVFLVDIAINKARITTWMLNALSNAVGSSIQFVPC